MTEKAGNRPARGNWIGQLFRITLLLKAADSVVELATGVALHVASAAAIVRMTRALTRHRLLEHPDDVVANYLLRTAETLSLDQKSAAALYLASHGAVKLFLVVMVLRGKMWAYPVFMVALVLLIAYQSYQLSIGFSPWLVGLTVLDVVVLVLTWHEYRRRRSAAVS